MRIFVSAENIDDPLATSLLHALRDAGWEVEHSARHGQSCYSPAITRALQTADRVVTVVTAGWDGSTWMCSEAETAQKAGVPLFCWNPQDRPVPLGMRRYAWNPLPADLAMAVAAL